MGVKAFIFENHEKKMTFQAYLYSAYFRFLIKHVNMNRIEKKMGVLGEESCEEETEENIRYAKLVKRHVNRVTSHTPWKSKCYVQALTASRLLMKKKIPCTIYMGIMKENNALKAHAWLRCGSVYVTGGNFKGFTVVAKYKYGD